MLGGEQSGSDKYEILNDWKPGFVIHSIQIEKNMKKLVDHVL